MASRYVVVKYGYLNRGETLNIAVLAWEHDKGTMAPVVQHVLSDWTRVNQAFPRAGANEFQSDALNRLSCIKVVGDYELYLRRMGPGWPFEFTEERPSTANPEETLKDMAEFFLGPYKG
jgi:hypothetical protein